SRRVWRDPAFQQKRRIGCLVKWRGCRVRCRVRQWRVHTRLGRPVRAEKHTREQAEVANATEEKPAALIESSKGNKESIGRNVTIRAEETTGALPEIGDNKNICLVISGASYQPCLPLAHVIGCSQVRIPISATNLQATEF